MARLLSVNVGLPREIEWQRKTVHTAVWKTPVQGRRREFYSRGTGGYRSVHWRSLPDRRCLVRSDAAARHLLSGRHPA